METETSVLGANIAVTGGRGGYQQGGGGKCPPTMCLNVAFGSAC